MRRVLTFAVLAVALAALLLPPVAAGSARARWIVQLEPGARLAEVTHGVRSRLGVTPGQRFGHVLNGFAATMTLAQRDTLAADPRVHAIVPDLPISVAADPYPPTDAEVQPGIQRVGSLANADRDGDALDVDIAVLDTGIQPDNLELNVVGGYNCTDPDNPNGGYSDAAYFGHGTHVAGIAAARQNGSGVAGVAQGARLWAIKVLNNGGNGYWSWVICGLDRVVAMTDGDGQTPTIEVVNMSLAAPGADDGDCGSSNNDLLHQAICRVADAGITLVAAAGNESRDAAGYVPGAYDEVITVSAMADWNGLPDGTDSPPAPGAPPLDCPREYGDDTFAEFSNFGPDVDLIAPGTCVLSTLPVDTLGLMTGTSMATPHVAGGAALYYLAEARAGRPRPTPQQVRAALVARGTLDWMTASDADLGRPNSVREPALNVSDFELAPFFVIGTVRQAVRAPAGSRATNEIWTARIGGFGGAITLAVDAATLPAGADATLSGNTLRIDLPQNAVPGAYEVRVHGSSGVASGETTFRLVVYNSVADANGPAMSIRSAIRAGAVTIPIRVSWPSVSKARRYELQQSVDGSPWATIAKPYRARFDILATPGRRYQHRVRARVGGVWREWLNGPSAVVNTLDPGSTIDLAGIWLRANIGSAYSELPVYSTDPGANSSLTFTGRSVAWIGSRGPTRGKVRILIDGSLVATLDLYASRPRHRLLLFAHSWSAAGLHTIRIEVTGLPTSRPRIDLDALVIVAD